jgi:hypothetical protein
MASVGSMTTPDGIQLEDNFINHIYNGFLKTTEFCTALLDSLKNLITGGIQVNQMTGIVGISMTPSNDRDRANSIAISMWPW